MAKGGGKNKQGKNKGKPKAGGLSSLKPPKPAFNPFVTPGWGTPAPPNAFAAAAQAAYHTPPAAAAKPPAAKPPAAKPPAAPAAGPKPPAMVNPFLTPEQLAQVNDWLTDWSTKMQEIDFGIQNLQTDTKFQKDQNARAATDNRVAADDAMAGRGIFTSSLRDAAVYDIEATRALNDKYLDDKLQQAVTQGTTQKGTLATAKTKFDTAMIGVAAQNAKGVNDAANKAFAAAVASAKPPQPGASGAPAAPGASGSKPPTVVASGPQAASAFKQTQSTNAAKQQKAAAKAKANAKAKGKPKIAKIKGPAKVGLGRP